VDYYSLLGDFTRTSKSENLIIDAIDVGTGLYLVGGDGVSTDGVLDDFVSFDEGTVNNRYGYVATEGGVLFATGKLGIGQTNGGVSTVTEFTDSGKTVVWTNGYAETGFHEFLIDLATANTSIELTNCSLGSLGKENNDADRGYTTTEDTRCTLTVTGLATGTDFTMTGCVVNNFRRVNLNDRCVIDSSTFTDCERINLVGSSTTDGATFTNCTVDNYTGNTGTGALRWNVNADPDGNCDNLTITKGSGTTHAIQFGSSTPNTITLRGWTVSGYNAADGQNDSTIYVNDTTGTYTINIIDGTGNFSARSAGATVNLVISPVTTRIEVRDENDAALAGARVAIEAGDGTGDLPYQDSVSISQLSGTATVTHTSHGLSTNERVIIRGCNEQDYNGTHTITVVNANSYTYTIDAGAPANATGSPNSTGVVVDGTTDVAGVVQGQRSFSVDQPVLGRVRLATSPPLYKAVRFTDSVDSSNGLTRRVSMQRDD
jgi:hypothetical protein